MSIELADKITSSDQINRIHQLGPARRLGFLRLSHVRTFAGWCFGVSILTSPMRYRFILLERTVPDIFRDYTDVLLYVSDVFLILTLIAWFVSLLLERKAIDFGPGFVTIPLFGLLFFSLVSVFFSIDPFLSVYNLIRLTLLTLVYFYLINEIRSLSQFILPVGAMLFIQASIAIAQVLEQSSIGLLPLGELELNPEWNGISIVAADGLRYLRAYGLTDHPNILGGILALGMLLFISWAGIVKRNWLVILASVFTLTSVALLLTFSRSAWVAFAISSLLIFIMQARINRKYFLKISLTLIVASLPFLIPFLLTHQELLGIRLNFQNSFSQVPQEVQSIGERQLLFQEGNEIFSGAPITGVGLSTFPYALALLNPDFPVDYQPAHFVLLDVAVETGIFGAFFYAILMTSPWLVLWLNRQRINFSPSLIGISGLLMAITIIGFFDYYPWLLAAGRFWQWLAWGAWAAIYQSSKK